jgi:dihydroorotate dehydrogenase
MLDPVSVRLRYGDVLWRRVLRPHLFGKEAEDAHLFTIAALRRLQALRLLGLVRVFYRSPLYRMPVSALRMPARSPVGLAAGFDKHGEVIPALDALGFGSVEIGTVTPRPQFGNPRPRSFRNAGLGAILNRYGFNSEGSTTVARRLRALHRRTHVEIPIGISIGKNKETAEADAVKDYLTVYQDFADVLRPTDWVKINISSPNTPQLRDTFARLDEFLGEFVEGARKVPLAFPHRFVLKVPPDDLTVPQLQNIVDVCARHRFVGIEATNTTVDETIKAACGWSGEAGGVSGEPLRRRATETLEAMREAAMAKGICLIGVGGISRGEHALEKRAAGASAVQCYTGLVFRGPVLLHEILSAWK